MGTNCVLRVILWGKVNHIQEHIQLHYRLELQEN
jgi:hypothetical protein